MQMTKKGILFDLDGTLINTYENINYKKAFSELKSVQKTLILRVIKSRVRSFAEMEKKIMEISDDPVAGNELIQRVSDFLMMHYDHAPLKKDALAFLQYLKQRGYKICLCTNNATQVVAHILKEKNIDMYFDHVITSQQVTKSKPDPQMYLEALAFLQLSPAECIVFEDTENGVMAAYNAGIDVIVVNEKEKRKYNHCDMIIKDYGDDRLYAIF